ncbi:hypothetical protein, partial [Anaerophaga thermohalophila]|uniref:hypothetical protein n=1 Tax=Anaerophaga thermohalophila TaxID=177400 RepID=UPI001C400280
LQQPASSIQQPASSNQQPQSTNQPINLPLPSSPVKFPFDITPFAETSVFLHRNKMMTFFMHG